MELTIPLASESALSITDCLTFERFNLIRMTFESEGLSIPETPLEIDFAEGVARGVISLPNQARTDVEMVARLYGRFSEQSDEVLLAQSNTTGNIIPEQSNPIVFPEMNHQGDEFDANRNGRSNLEDLCGTHTNDVGFDPAPMVTPVDTTAAGDSFCGGLADGLVRGLDLVEATRWAVRVG